MYSSRDSFTLTQTRLRASVDFILAKLDCFQAPLLLYCLKSVWLCVCISIYILYIYICVFMWVTSCITIEIGD